MGYEYCGINVAQLNFITATHIKIREDKKQCQKAERRALTPQLRYEVLKGDGFRCRKCGRTANDGITLHVDHIVPVSKGGKTVLSNLETLCCECNLGKLNY